MPDDISSSDISELLKMKSFLLFSALSCCVMGDDNGYEEPPYTTVYKTKVQVDMVRHVDIFLNFRDIVRGCMMVWLGGVLTRPRRLIWIPTTTTGG